MAIALLTKVKRLFFKGSFASNVLTVSTGIVIGQGLCLVASPIITRLYAPGDLGVLGVYVALLGIFGGMASLRYVYAIPLPKSDVAAANLCALCLAATILMSGFAGLLIWLWGEPLLTLVKAQRMKPYIWLLALGILGSGFYHVLNFWGIRQKAFGIIAWTKITQNLGRITAMVSLGSVGLGPLGLLVGEIIGRCSGSVRLALFAWRQDKSSFQEITMARVLEVLRRYKKFPLFSMSTLLNVVSHRTPALLLASFYGLQVVGWITLAHWVISTPITLIGSSISQVYQAEFAQMARRSPADLSKLYFRTLKALSLVALVLVPFISICAPWLISLMFGQQWGEAGTYIQVLALMYGLQLVATPLLDTLDILERQDLGLVREILRGILVVGTIPLAAALKQPPVIAVLFYGIAGGISYLIDIAATWYVIKKNALSEKLTVSIPRSSRIIEFFARLRV